MDVSGLLHALLAHWIEDLFIAGVTALFGILKYRESRWAGVLLYAFVGLASSALIIFAFTGRAVFSFDTPQTTPENIEANVKTWADAFSLGIQKVADPNYSFVYAISLRSGRSVLVGHPKD